VLNSDRDAFLLTRALPDEASGQGPGSFAERLSRCKEGMARVFAIMVQVGWVIQVSRYKWEWSYLNILMKFY